ncbi:type II secretion system protein [Candidatus Sumerlaeota bacterium]|nr:type II secretion system protein [Candidatus Sumerlaeota bacterium]
MNKISFHIFTMQRGFTFVEILAAMLFMAIIIPVVIHGMTIANRAGIAAERKRLAAEMADRKLTEILLEESWRDGDQEGTFEETDENGGSYSLYRWSLETNAWEEDAMRLVTTHVFYKVQDREYSVSLSALAPEEETSTE